MKKKKIIDDIIIDTNNKIYKELSIKIKNLKKKGMPLLIKINSHPCSGKTTFINRCKNNYKGCKIYDMDKCNGKDGGKTSYMLLEKKCNSILLGGSFTKNKEFHKPDEESIDYNKYENVIYIFAFPKLMNCYKNIIHRHITKGLGRSWSHPNAVLLYRYYLYKSIIKEPFFQIAPLFYSFKEAIDFCIKEYND